MSPILRRCFGISGVVSFSYTFSTVTPAISTQPVNLSNPALYVRSQTISQVTNFENVVGSQESSDILAKVQIQTLPGTVIQWTNPADLEVDISNKSVDSVSLYLGSDDSYQIDLGGLDWSCRLTIQEWSYRKDSHGSDRPDSEPQDIKPLLDLRDQAIKRLQRLKSKVIPDATQAQG